ncbi:WD repeat-containing protein DDB_G0290555-like [Manihot esculenta]|uniref:WD repeat-containing protein DDB_G0290555-like n=1 Tax=Manihot esculenta TaxID=3983 RepID=UPI001CC75DF0|nr:WD repeat-containing protein DDB_G0290555-like [Manihot esculenta]
MSSGSIRSIARHPELPVIGLGSYLRLWDIKTRQLLSAVLLKQHLANVVFYSNFTDREITVQAQSVNEIQKENENSACKKKESI